MNSIKRLMLSTLAVTTAIAGASNTQASVIPNQPQHQSKALQFDVALSNLSVLAGTQQKAYLNIDITGLPSQLKKQRPKTNIAFVLDKSGSMSGQKMIQAKQALEMAVSKLTPNDVASLVVYDDEARVIWPAATMQHPQQFLNTIRSIDANGSTALFAGVTQGSFEIRKYLDQNKVNRVILLSDGMANVGPSKPHELAELGRALSKQRISVSTIGLGLGYNEDLMTQLAGHSDGNHYFVENADKLADVFNSELGDIFSVVAQNIQININCRDGVKPIRILGRDEHFTGQNIKTNFNQIYGNQKRHLTLELLLPPGTNGAQMDVADVTIAYNDAALKQQLSFNDSVAVTYTNQDQQVEKDKNSMIYDNVTTFEANEVSKQVVRLRDEGDLEGAKKLQSQNISNLSQKLSGSAAPQRIQEQIEQEEQLLDSLDKADWNKARKQVRQKQYKIDNQQSEQDDDSDNK
ncbi:MAG: VWA domain-containing protein [Xanthomonadales bacterium]|nr:VWA domain-containing protein [Xanthomonadales bacterium]